MHNEILKNFPDVEFHLKLSSLFFYNKLVGKPLNDFRVKHFEDLNRKSKGSNHVQLILNKNLSKDKREGRGDLNLMKGSASIEIP